MANRFWNDDHDMCIMAERIGQVTLIKIESYPDDKANDPNAKMTITVSNDMANKLSDMLKTPEYHKSVWYNYRA